MGRSRNADYEKLDDASMDKAIACLENKGTKKEACSIINISYNTTRLSNLIDKYLVDKAKNAAKRAEKRGKPANNDEISFTISSYLEGGTVESISKSLYRGATFVNSILERCGVPIRTIPHNYFRPGLVPEAAMRDRFKVGEKVYSMRYDSLAEIMNERSIGIYQIYLLSEKWKQFAFQESAELASLDHLREYGVRI